jgi:hypothetical protein
VTLSEQSANNPLKVLMSFQGSELKQLQNQMDELLVIGEKMPEETNEFKNLSEKYVTESIDLFKAMLTDNNITHEDIKRIDFCLQSELATKIGGLFQTSLIDLNMDTKNFHCQKDLNCLEEITNFVSHL